MAFSDVLSQFIKICLPKFQQAVLFFDFPHCGEAPQKANSQHQSLVVASWKNFVGLCSFSRIFPKSRCFICPAVPFFLRKNGRKDKKWNTVKCNAYWSILISFSSFNERMQMRMPMVMLKERRRNFPLQFCATILR